MDLITTQENAAANLPQLEVEIKFYLGQTAQNIIEVGKRLIQAKSLVQHGEWLNWLEKNFQLKQRAAQTFMACAERFGNTQTSAHLNQSQMIEMLSLPDAEETEKFIAEKAAEGKAVADMTIKQLREEIAQYKATIENERQAHQQSLFDRDNQIGDLEKKLAEKPTVVEKLPDDYAETKSELISAHSELSEVRGQVDELQDKLADAHKKIDKLKEEKKRSDDIRKQLEQIKERGVEKPDGLFDVIVIDPPYSTDINRKFGS